MDPLELIRLPGLMAVTAGRADLVIGLLDGPVALHHPDLAGGHVRYSPGTAGNCADVDASCRHGTFVAGVLAARRGAQAPAIAPGCSMLVHPIFTTAAPAGPPRATPAELAAGIVACVEAGARILNLSVGPATGHIGTEGELTEALSYAARRQVLVVAAAGNEGMVGGSAITRHPWVISVVGYARSGRPLPESNLGRRIGGGLGSPGEGVTSLSPAGEPAIMAGTGVAAPFVTGTAALMWSVFSDATAAEIKHALLSSAGVRRGAIVPPLLNAGRAYELLLSTRAGRAAP